MNDDGTRARHRAGGAVAPEAQRLADLEAELAFQGDALRELNEALATQQLDLMEAKRQLQVLREQIVSLRTQLAEHRTEQGDERPPHY